MSRQWWFSSYDPTPFSASFDGTAPDAARRVAEAATWDDGVWENPAAAGRLAAHITSGGIRYDGLSAAGAAALDRPLPMLFAPEGLAGEWGVAPESPDGLDPRVVRELLARAGGAVLLPVLLGGRRFGADGPSECGYCFLSPAECESLAAEAEAALASGGPWSG